MSLLGVKTRLSPRQSHSLRVSASRVPRRVVTVAAGVTGDGRKLHSEELANLCASADVIRMIKSRIIRRARGLGHFNA